DGRRAPAVGGVDRGGGAAAGRATTPGEAGQESLPAAALPVRPPRELSRQLRLGAGGGAPAALRRRPPGALRAAGRPAGDRRLPGAAGAPLPAGPRRADRRLLPLRPRRPLYRRHGGPPRA